jgi:hypothetical protein
VIACLRRFLVVSGLADCFEKRVGPHEGRVGVATLGLLVGGHFACATCPRRPIGLVGADLHLLRPVAQGLSLHADATMSVEPEGSMSDGGNRSACPYQNLREPTRNVGVATIYRGSLYG